MDPFLICCYGVYPMKRSPLAIAVASFSLAIGFSSQVFSAETGATPVEQVIIKALRDDRKSSGATGMDLSAFETPQSLTILDAATVSDFGLEDINSLLELTTGVNVDAAETDRTYYNSRGFDITSMHVDGIGVPFGELVVGDIDTAIYDKVEVIRGSNGLITGLGNPSGTVNYVRKRPGNEFDASTSITAGRWNDHRIVADVSTPLTATGSWAARFTGVYQEKDSWLDHYSNERTVGSLVVDGQLSNALTLALGYTWQDNNSDGVLWGAVPVIYNNGQPIDFDVSTSTTMDWTYWNTRTQTAFAELDWQISDRWNLMTSATRTDYDENSEVFYVYWNTGLDPATGLGLNGYPGKYDDFRETLVWDTRLQGRFTAFQREHQIHVGLSMADSDSHALQHSALSGFDVMPSFPGWTGNEVPRPLWDAPAPSANEDMELNRLYGSVLLSLTDRLNVILGVSKVDYKNRGISYGVSTDSDEDGGSPYAGFTWEMLDGLNVYGSYSDIYQPQYYLNEDLQPLGSAQGKSYELGLKKQFNNNVLASLAVFRTEQENLQEFSGYSDGDGVDDDDYSDDFTWALYRGINVEAEGIELEVAGNVTDTLRLQAGFTHLKLEDPDHNKARTFIPRNSLKLLAAWSPQLPLDLDFGLSLRWQDEVYFDSSYGRISQDAYAVLGGYVSYAMTDDLRLSFNLNNAADKKYFSSVKYEQSYYAEPRSYSLSLVWDY